jgi:hypothetical protein
LTIEKGPRKIISMQKLIFDEEDKRNNTGIHRNETAIAAG